LKVVGRATATPRFCDRIAHGLKTRISRFFGGFSAQFPRQCPGGKTCPYGHPEVKLSAFLHPRMVKAMAGKVFISYRRDDTGHQADRIYAAFCDTIQRDHVFMDVDSIPPVPISERSSKTGSLKVKFCSR
jgi:hypothetical protein